ncbi:hypothetical protein [Rubrimonas sp.]|uniref:hypothetical protein n=1 Tax=Rubrimonas sp. TaxID=2036015 RepID=UPI002FDC8072
MTRALRAPATGVLLADQRSGGVLLLNDLPGDGTADQRRTFFDGANASGLGVPANPFTILQASDGAVYVGDGASDTVYRLVDRDRSGAANGPGEATVWLSEANAAGLSLPTPNGLAEGPDGAIYRDRRERGGHAART